MDAGESMEQVVKGLIQYFDRSLGKILLYRMERLQYSEYIKSKPDVPPSEYYGAEHLLRLFGISF